jgi:hypothetical protein
MRCRPRSCTLGLMANHSSAKHLDAISKAMIEATPCRNKLLKPAPLSATQHLQPATKGKNGFCNIKPVPTSHALGKNPFCRSRRDMTINGSPNCLVPGESHQSLAYWAPLRHRKHKLTRKGAQNPEVMYFTEPMELHQFGKDAICPSTSDFCPAVSGNKGNRGRPP